MRDDEDEDVGVGGRLNHIRNGDDVVGNPLAWKWKENIYFWDTFKFGKTQLSANKKSYNFYFISVGINFSDMLLSIKRRIFKTIQSRLLLLYIGYSKYVWQLFRISSFEQFFVDF